MGFPDFDEPAPLKPSPCIRPAPSSGFTDFDIPRPLVAPRCKNFMRRGLARLTEVLATTCAESVLYCDLLGNRIPCRATLGSKLLKLDDGNGGFRMEMTDLDFLIPARDLAVDGVRIEPKRGDLIVLPIGTDEQTFEVMPYAGEAPWRWSDPFQSMRRIHTKLVDEEPYA